ncbi:hypothetical protein ACFX2K_037973 [Malus domestica]
MASFISKLSRECDQCQKILDRSSIKTIRFESNMSTSHQILGPLLKRQYHQPLLDFSRSIAYHPCSKGLNGRDGMPQSLKAPGLRPLQPGQPGSYKWKSSSVSNGRTSVSTTPSSFRLWMSFSRRSFF